MSSLGYFSLSPSATPFASPILAKAVAAIDWVKRIVGIMGCLGNLVRASLLQNRGHIHHSRDGVEIVLRGGRFRGSMVSLSGLFRLLNQKHQMNRIDQMN
jgi:hypothetical protein